MTRKRLDQYKGRLEANKIAEGMNEAIQNAKRLVEDAKILFDAGRHPSACSLAILSIEEAGKVAILRQLSVAEDQKEIVNCWRDYRSHTKKNVMWIMTQLAAEGARKLDDFLPIFKQNADHPYLLDQVKQLGFYTDCLGKAHWSEPTEVINEKFARMILKIAEITAPKREVTTREVELWIKHIGPVWMKHPAWMKKALEDWYEAMQEEGLVPPGENEMRGFIRHGISGAD
jgi:AbiV family abortive infection protein